MLNVVGFWPECSIIWFLCPLLQDMYQFHEVNRTCCIFYQYKWCHSEDFCVYEPGVYTSMLYCINHVHLVVDILDQRVWVHFPFLSTCVLVYLWWLIIYLNPFIGHSGICWALKIIVSITCLEWCFWHAVSINVDEHFFKKFSIKNFSLLPVFLVLMLLYQLYQFM